MTTITINLANHRDPQHPLVFAGRDRGSVLREAYNLDDADENKTPVVVQVPEDAFAVTTSFCTGLLAPVARNFGVSRIRNGYRFTGPNTEELISHFLYYFDLVGEAL